MMKLKNEMKQDLLLIVKETEELMYTLVRKINCGFIKDEKIIDSYRTLDTLISSLDPELNEYNELLIKIANEVRLLLDVIRKMTFTIEDGHIINQYWKLRDLIRFFDFILGYYHELKTLPPKYDYKPKQVYDV